MKSQRTWGLVRYLGLVVTVGSAPMFYNTMQAEFAGQVPSWSFIFAVFGFCALGIPFVLSLQFVNPSSAKKWLRPSWSSNLMDPRQPLPVFDYGGWMFLTLGLSLAAYTAWIGSRNLLFVLPLLIGAGTLVGVRLSMLMFRSKLLEPGGENDAA